MNKTNVAKLPILLSIGALAALSFNGNCLQVVVSPHPSRPQARLEPPTAEHAPLAESHFAFFAELGLPTPQISDHLAHAAQNDPLEMEQLAEVAGVSHRDLPDQPYRDWYEDGVGAAEAAAWALEDSDFPEELLLEFAGV